MKIFFLNYPNVARYLIPLLIFTIPILFKYIIDERTFNSRESEIVAIQFLFTFVWLYTGRILSKKKSYSYILAVYFMIYLFFFSYVLLFNYVV